MIERLVQRMDGRDVARVRGAGTAVCAALAVYMLVVGSGVGSEVVLVRKGRPVARIYTPGPAATPTLTRGELRKLTPEQRMQHERVGFLARAAQELNYHLEKMSGTALEVVASATAVDVKGPAIVLDSLARELGAQPGGSGDAEDQGFRLLSRDDLVLIGGASEQGTLYGAYELLSKLGCDWVMPGEIGEIIPRRVTVTLGELDEWQVPAFPQRRLWYRGYNQPRLPEEGRRFAQWLERQKGGSCDIPAARTGGHVWGGFVKRHQAEFEKDPTMYALRRAGDGSMKRMGPQIESTHPRVVELFVQDIRQAFEKNGWPKNKAAGFGIGPADGLGYSQSAESTAAGSGRMDPIVGEPDRTDLLVLLANEIFEALGDEYPNVYLGCYSYSTHADYPMRYRPHPRYVQIFAPINFSRFHGVMDPASKTQAYYRSVVEQWGKLHDEQGNVLFYRGYNWNLAENMMPYSKVRIWGEELPFYRKVGIAGLNVEATKAWSINGPSDYVFMRLAWDTTLDWQDLLREYCGKAFGKGAGPMERYFLRLIETQHGAGQEAGSYHAFHLIFDDAFVTAARNDFGEAKRMADTQEDKTRIEHTACGVEALGLYLTYHRATMAFDFAAAKQGYDAMIAHWQSTYDVNTDLVANETPGYLKRFIAKFVDQAVQYSSGDYRLVLRIPDELPTLFDPNDVGHRMRYQDPTINDAQCVKTRTISTTWDAQGLTGLRTGTVWYRHRFALPADLKGKPIGLFVGGVEDEARVWINGKVVGTSGRRFSVPAVFDLTDGIYYDAQNLLAVQVVRNSAANEIGLGGIIRPCFLFTGPRLETKAPRPLALRRVLPGGELGGEE